MEPDFNIFKEKNPNSQYDETIYPVDHDSSGQIRDFSLFNHFIKPMKVSGGSLSCQKSSWLDFPVWEHV